MGRTLPAHAPALGKALLAELTDDEVAALLPEKLAPLTPHTVGERALLKGHLAKIRQTGVATEIEESSLGVRCAAAVVPYRIPATDALSCSMPLKHATDQDAERVTELLREAADDLGRTLRREGIR